MTETASAEASGEGMRGSQANTDNKLQRLRALYGSSLDKTTWGHPSEPGPQHG